jgi:hypothetical protein
MSITTFAQLTEKAIETNQEILFKRMVAHNNFILQNHVNCLFKRAYRDFSYEIQHLKEKVYNQMLFGMNEKNYRIPKTDFQLSDNSFSQKTLIIDYNFEDNDIFISSQIFNYSESPDPLEIIETKKFTFPVSIYDQTDNFKQLDFDGKHISFYLDFRDYLYQLFIKSISYYYGLK